MRPFKDKNTLVYTNEMKKQDSLLGAVINSMTTLRRRLGTGGLFGVSPDGKRDFNALFGYGVTLSYDDYYGMYLRGGIAKTVVDKIPKACWRDVPVIKVGETEILKEQLQTLRNVGFFKAMERADKLNRIGQFSVLVLGVPDGQDLEQPLGSAKSDNFKSMWFNPYSYGGTEIVKWDEDPASPRFSLPLLYSVQASTTRTGQDKDINTKAFIVHWSRVVHMAEDALESSIEGISSLQAVWNAFIDKNKTRGSSAEAFYRNSRQKLALEADSDTQLDTSEDAKKALKSNVENFQNGLEDVLRLGNMKANMLQPGLVSPRDTFDICIEEISGTTGIPLRVLGAKTGGNTTGQEDKATWNALIKDRQEADVTVWLIRALTIMSEAGLLTLPENVNVEWPPMSALTEKDEAEIIDKKANAFNKTVDGLSKLGSSDIDPESVFDEIGLDKIEIDSLELDDNKIDEIEGDQ